mgnify:FL=1
MKKVLTMLLIATTLSGCASIIKGGNQNINIMTSDGENINATIFSKAGMMDTQLPRLVSVQKDSQDITIRVKEDKCHQETVTVVNSHVEPWFWGNILSGGVLGSTTDSSTGAMWKYDETVVVTPNKKNTCSK